MTSVIKLAKTVRNNWKKSVFAALAVSYGISYGNEKYKINCLMRAYCKEAVKYGDCSIGATTTPKNVTVILNPAANKRSANDSFKKYCEPILHLGGFTVNIISTTSEGSARKTIEEMPNLPDAILVAGGDGTLAETVTGMLRRSDGATCPIGVLPLGRCSNVGSEMFPGVTESGVERVSALAKSAMAVLQGKETYRDVMQIKLLANQDSDEELKDVEIKPVYAVGSLQWGAFRDALSSRDKYWYYGPLREYVTFLFNGYKETLTWSCKALLSYSDPCAGCQNCVQNKPKTQYSTWWKRILPKVAEKEIQNKVDYSKIFNEDCAQLHKKSIETLDFHLTTSKEERSGTPSLRVKLGPEKISYSDFVAEGWKRVKGDDSTIIEKLDARMLEIIPETISSKDKPVWFAIDNEEYEVKPIRVTLVPNAIKVFCS